MKRNLLIILSVLLIISIGLNIYLFNLKEVKNVPAVAKENDNLPNIEQQKFLSYNERKFLLENKKKFLKDMLEVIPIVEEEDINNSTIDSDLHTLKSIRQKHYQMIQKALREADYYSLTGDIRDKTVYEFINDKVKGSLYSNYKEDEYTYYYRIEPADPEETVLRDKKGYFYYVFLFTDSYEVNPADPYGDIKKLVILVEKAKNNWLITELTYNN